MCEFLFSHTPPLPRQRYKLFGVPGAPLVVSVGFGPSCFFCLPVSVIGHLWCTASRCLRLTHRTEQKEKRAARICNLRESGRDQTFEPAVLNSSRPSLKRKVVASLIHEGTSHPPAARLRPLDVYRISVWSQVP